MFLSLALHAPRVYVLRERVQTGRTKSTGPPRLQYLSAQRLRHCLVRDPGINGLCTQHLDPRNKLSRFERDDERLTALHSNRRITRRLSYLIHSVHARAQGEE